MAENKQAPGTDEKATPETTDASPTSILTTEEAATLEQEGRAVLFEMGEDLPDAPDIFNVPAPEKPDNVVSFAEAAEKASPVKEEQAKPEVAPDKPKEVEKPKDAVKDKTAKSEKLKPDKTRDASKPNKGRPPKTGKAANDKAHASKPRDTLFQSKEPPAEHAIPFSVLKAQPEATAPPRPVEEGQTVYQKLAVLNPFHTFRPHPYQVRDDPAMAELVSTIKAHGVMTPITVRPEKDGNGYEIISGHRRCHASELAGLAEIPCIVRNMTDHEAVQEMKISNKQRGDPLPSELARLLDLEMEDIKHQGTRLEGSAAGDAGKRSAEIVGENNGMNYKKVMRYIRLNSLTPELLNMVDEKRIGFMPAVELSFIKPKNQRLIAVSIEGEQSSPSLSQAQKLRELDKDGKLNGDVIDGILSQEKKEVEKVIISTAELNKYFGKEKTPREMKDQIIALLDEWQAKQPPELSKPEKKADLEK